MTNQEITYNEAAESTDVDTLAEYCVQGAIDCAKNHNGPISAWRNGWELVEAYLDHNTVADRDTLKAVAACLDEWLSHARIAEELLQRWKCSDAKNNFVTR